MKYPHIIATSVCGSFQIVVTDWSELSPRPSKEVKSEGVYELRELDAGGVFKPIKFYTTGGLLLRHVVALWDDAPAEFESICRALPNEPFDYRPSSLVH